MTYSIVAEGLAKQFGTTRVLDGIDLEVPTGTVFGLLVPSEELHPIGFGRENHRRNDRPHFG